MGGQAEVCVSYRQKKFFKMSKGQKLGFAENFALSGAAAVISKTAAAPIERVKLLVQNQDEMIKQGRLDKPYKGVIDCTARTFKNEGFLPFWRGNLANCIRYFPTQALNFAFKDHIKAMFKASKADSYGVAFGKNIASGGMAGAMSLCFVYSLDYARTSLANDAKSGKKGGERQFNGLVDVYRKTLKSDGVQGLYRGFVIGYVVTISSGLVSYPVDTIRRRMMMTSGEAVKYKGSVDCAVQVIKGEGFMSLMKGAGANILRGV